MDSIWALLTAAGIAALLVLAPLLALSLTKQAVPALKATRNSDQRQSASDLKERFIRRLERYYSWYARIGGIYGTCWYAAGITITVLGTLTSLFVALNFAESEGWGKIVTIVLPAVAALISTAVTQFRVREHWELREYGRINVLRLIAEAKRVDEAADGFRSELHKIESRLIDIEMQQAQSFYGSFGGNGTKP